MSRYDDYTQAPLSGDEWQRREEEIERSQRAREARIDNNGELQAVEAPRRKPLVSRAKARKLQPARKAQP